ncbi:MAG: hypothetical protein R3B96_23505 [Pirellulaceae bacterium]
MIRENGKRHWRSMWDEDAGPWFPHELPILFRGAPAVKVTLDVIDHDGQPVTAQFVFRDKLGNIYPVEDRRLAPDFFFHDQIYRADGESVQLPPGEYEVSWSRGPEYVTQTRSIQVPAVAEHRESFRLQRWIHLAPMAVLRRSPCACGRLRSLSVPDRGCDSRGHDEAHPGRGS